MKYKCFLCDDGDDPKKDASGWDKASLGFVLRQLKLCQDHTKEVEKKLAVAPDVAPEPPKPFIPKPVQEKPHYTEREPGEEG